MSDGACRVCNRDTVSDLAGRLASDLEIGAEIPLHRLSEANIR